MGQLRDVLINQLRDLLHAEHQLIDALPKMADAAHNAILKEAFQKHRAQTEAHQERLRKIFSVLGEPPEPKVCKAILGLIQEGQDTIEEGRSMPQLAADLALIAAAQRVEHYEISAYGTARSLARQIGEYECAHLLSHTLGDEESTDYLLTAISDPILQQCTLEDEGADVNLETVGVGGKERRTAGKAKTGRTGQGAM
jgi:Mn-containing catalase